MHAVPEAVPDLLFKQASLSNQDSSNIVGTARFSAAHRLLRAEGFDRVVQAKSISDNSYKIFFARNNKNNARLGIITSKKAIPRAVDRNRVRRIIREAFRQHSIKSLNLDLVVLVRRPCDHGLVLQSDDLRVLLSRVEDKCAESLSG